MYGRARRRKNPPPLAMGGGAVWCALFEVQHIKLLAYALKTFL